MNHQSILILNDDSMILVYPLVQKTIIRHQRHIVAGKKFVFLNVPH